MSHIPHTCDAERRRAARELAEHTAPPPQSTPNQHSRGDEPSRKLAASIRESAGLPEPLWKTQATDESGCVVASAPMSKEDIAIDHIAHKDGRTTWVNTIRPIVKEYTDEIDRQRAAMLNEAQKANELVDKYTTKDSGKRDVFATGAQRDTQEGKGRYDLVPARAIRRIAQLFQRGARKYNEDNFRKGMPFRRVIDSMLRHADQFKDATVMPDDGEDHLAAVAWNAIVLMEYEEAIKAGQLPAELDDRFRYPK